jgi:adenylosuccinate synthase
VAATVVTGTQWGDEGKGKVVDYLAEKADVVVRFNGGANAGHTVVTGATKFAFHLVPSGVTRPATLNVIAAGVALDPEVLAEEIEAAKKAFGGVRLLVSERAHVVTPFHKLMDEAREGGRDGSPKLGTTKRGIGPLYEQKAARTGLRVGDLVHGQSLRAHVEREAKRFQHLVPAERAAEFAPGAVLGRLEAAAKAVAPYVGDAETALWDAEDHGKSILLEGAQAVMLDIDFGTYPYVTSSSCSAGAAAALSGLPPRAIQRSVGVVKAYTTRVGDGPFPTELLGPEGDALRNQGSEFGTTTGRPRRCGWLDLVVVRRAVRLSGLTDIAVTKLDVLAGVKPLKVCVAYELDSKRTESVPARADDYSRCRPVMEEVEPIGSVDWADFVAKRKPWGDLPAAARDYLALIEKRAGCRVSWVGVGPARSDILLA